HYQQRLRNSEDVSGSERYRHRPGAKTAWANELSASSSYWYTFVRHNFAENLAKGQFLCYNQIKSFRLELKGCAILPADFLGLQKAAKRPSVLLCPNAGKCAPALLT